MQFPQKPLNFPVFLQPYISPTNLFSTPMPAAARSMTSVYGRSLAGVLGSNPAKGMDVCVSRECCVCCQVQIFAMGRSLIQRSPTECSVSECDLETPPMRRPRPTRAVER
jgi:hypothetical protein